MSNLENNHFPDGLFKCVREVLMTRLQIINRKSRNIQRLKESSNTNELFSS